MKDEEWAMLRATEDYDIHGAVTIRIWRHERIALLPALREYLSSFQVPHSHKDPDIVLETGHFHPENQDCFLIDHQFHVRENYIYSEAIAGGAKFQVEIDGFDKGPTRVRCSGFFLGPRYVLGAESVAVSLFVQQLLAFHLARKGYLLVHAAGASKGGKAIIFYGRGGSYKTTLLMSLLRSHPGWRFLGDDTLIIGNGTVLSFPSWARVFDFRLRHLENEAMSFLDRIRLVLYLATKKETTLDICSESRLETMIGCTVGTGTQVKLIETDTTEAVSRLACVSRTEDHTSRNVGNLSIFPRYVEAYSYVFPDCALRARWRQAEDWLLAPTRSAKSMSLELPYSPTSADFHEAIELVKAAHSDTHH